MNLKKLFIKNLVIENINNNILLTGKDYEKFANITKKRGLIADETDFNTYMTFQYELKNNN